MNIPNQLTVVRIVLTLFFIYFISRSGLTAMLTATIIFTVASLTDWGDGYIAKKYNMISDFGKLMDPIADKFLILAAFVAFIRMHLVEDWMVVLILGREIMITGLRLFALSKGKVLSAERAGKHKTVSQIVAIFTILTFLVIREYLKITTQHWSANIELWWEFFIYILMLITVALTLISGLSYLWSNRKLIYVQ